MFLSLLILVEVVYSTEHVPITQESRLVLRCEDTTSGDDSNLSLCQWGCYRKCIAPFAGTGNEDIVISGVQFESCVEELPDDCRLHGSLYTPVLLDTYCIGDLGPSGGKYYKMFIPATDGIMYSDTFSPTNVLLGLYNQSSTVPTDECLSNSIYYVLAPTTDALGYTIQTDGIQFISSDDEAGYLSCPALPEWSSEQSAVTTFPVISETSYGIPLTNVSTALSISQRGMLVEDNVVVFGTPSKCRMTYPADAYLFLQGNFTMATGTFLNVATTGFIALLTNVFL
ncbi:putative transmembrane protein [Gregarina niphandrodes]|uniref:Transmembrane protein n=1 Tax=Gregarina niphandrodes TaxID=110365 RepID=A0A023B9E1_GRENI|nr:putative transmembrane protein [Gregarina niphandrodes]EZG72877.1 putative transmembrane protein [Gregarina niphandrodes]|eukprot:XP_011129736.1 putative transmembrane protein [Gregarina niphandrodes]